MLLILDHKLIKHGHKPLPDSERERPSSTSVISTHSIKGADGPGLDVSGTVKASLTEDDPGCSSSTLLSGLFWCVEQM